MTPNDLSIKIRDSQAPDAINAIPFANPSTKFVAANDSGSSSTSPSTTPSSASEDGSPANKPAGAAASSSTSPSTTPSLASEVESPANKPVEAAAVSSRDGVSSETLAVALGIAIPLGLLSIGCLVLLWRYRQRAISSRSPASQGMAEWPTNQTPETKQSGTWQNAPRGYQRAAGEMPDRGPMPELKGPGTQTHELFGSAAAAEKGGTAWPNRFPE
ncbi:MAG: hypothetical protein Q9164_006297 [Protoblastenia rupestris]